MRLKLQLVDTENVDTIFYLDDEGDCFTNKGNFSELVIPLSKYDVLLKEHNLNSHLGKSTKVSY